MTGRERILRMLRRQPVDRLLVAPFLYVNFVRKFYEDFNADCVEKTADVYRHFGMDIIHRNVPLPLGCIPPSGDGWDVSVTTEKSGHSGREVTNIRTPGGGLTQLVRTEPVDTYEIASACTEALIKTRDDFEIVRKHIPALPDLEFPDVRRAKRIVGEDGIIAPWVQGVFNFANRFRSMDALFADAILDEAFYRDIMEFSLERAWALIAKTIQAGASVVSYGGDVANARSVSPRYYEDYVFPYERELIRRIHGIGGMLIHHNCGCASKLMPFYARLELDVFETLTRPPYGDSDLDRAMEAFGGRTTLSGNLDQIDFLRHASPDAVFDETRRVIEKVKPYRHFILATSDYLNADTPFENVMAISRACAEFGSYGS